MQILSIKKGDRTIMPCYCTDDEIAEGLVKSRDGWTRVIAKENGIILILDTKAASTKGFFLSETQLREIGYVKIEKKKQC